MDKTLNLPLLCSYFACNGAAFTFIFHTKHLSIRFVKAYIQALMLQRAVFCDSVNSIYNVLSCVSIHLDKNRKSGVTNQNRKTYIRAKQIFQCSTHFYVSTLLSSVGSRFAMGMTGPIIFPKACGEDFYTMEGSCRS
jgi:hypothetical protein